MATKTLIDVEKNGVVVQRNIDHPGLGILIIGEFGNGTNLSQLVLLRTENDTYVTKAGEVFFDDDIKVVKILGDCVFSIYG